MDADNIEPPRTLATDVDIDSVTFRPPDGDDIAFRAIVDGMYGVYAIDFDGTNRRTILEPTVPLEMDNHAANMVFSPDGNRLFYQSYVPASEGYGEGCCQLWVVNADGSDAHPFGNVKRSAWSGVPSISPDGRWVSYWYVGDQPQQRVRIQPADENGQPIETGPVMSDFFPWLWSPDSSRILVFPEDGSTSSAYLLDPEGGPYETIPWETGSGIDWQRLAP